MKSEHYTIQDIKDGKVVIYYSKTDSNIEDLNRLLKICFPKDKASTKGISEYYGLHENRKGEWDGGSYL